MELNRQQIDTAKKAAYVDLADRQTRKAAGELVDANYAVGSCGGLVLRLQFVATASRCKKALRETWEFEGKRISKALVSGSVA